MTRSPHGHHVHCAYCTCAFNTPSDRFNQDEICIAKLHLTASDSKIGQQPSTAPLSATVSCAATGLMQPVAPPSRGAGAKPDVPGRAAAYSRTLSLL